MKPAKDEFRTATGLMGWTARFAARCSDDFALNDLVGNRKNLRGGLHELEFRQAIRIYFAEPDGQIVQLSGGSGKRNQDREIAKARARLKDFERHRIQNAETWNGVIIYHDACFAQSL